MKLQKEEIKYKLRDLVAGIAPRAPNSTWHVPTQKAESEREKGCLPSLQNRQIASSSRRIRPSNIQTRSSRSSSPKTHLTTSKPQGFRVSTLMGVPSEDVVVVQQGKKADEPCLITVNCPDKTGLGSDLCRIILEFGLFITKAGFISLGFQISALLSHHIVLIFVIT